MPTEAEQLQIRNRYRRRLYAAMTPKQRLARMAALQESCFAVLAQSPEGWQRFWRRNLKKRAVHHDPSKPF